MKLRFTLRPYFMHDIHDGPNPTLKDRIATRVRQALTKYVGNDKGSRTLSIQDLIAHRDRRYFDGEDMKKLCAEYLNNDGSIVIVFDTATKTATVVKAK